MKRKVIQTSLVFVLCFSLFGICYAGDYYLEAANAMPQFRLEATRLVIWGSAVFNATGFNSLTVTDEDVPYDTIRVWYGTMLAAKIAERQVRIIYDDSTGMIAHVIPR